MGNLINTIKRFIGNKNTVTILGVIAGVLVLWGFYSYRVKEATSPIRVPYAKEVIGATQEITEDNIGYTEINNKFLSTADIITSANELIGKYVNTGTSVPAGGVFYKSQVVNKSELPNTIFDNIADGYTIFGLGVNNHTTYGNSIYPGDRIDLYLKATDEDNRIMFGKFIESIEVLGVRDSSGKDVFSGTTARTPAELMFAVPDDMYELLMKAGYISGITIVPVPRNKKYTTEGGEVKTYEYLKNFILAKTAEIPTE
ncbi:MAG: hypothetical protein E7167_03360 [Firmicutes bacterium]|nr:hypothetical protein [Bacillota bacterium]